MKKITKTTLKKWEACQDGYERFNELFPKGADLKTASEGLIKDGKIQWANWLWEHCAKDDEYVDQTTITAGDRGTATAGNLGIATAGYRGTATAGNDGVISIEYWSEKKEKYLRKTGVIGEGDLKPNVSYCLDSDGNFIEKKNEVSNAAN